MKDENPVVPNVPNDNIVFFGQRVEPTFASAIVAGGLIDAKNLKERFDLTEPVGWFKHVANSEKHLYDFFNIQDGLHRFLDAVQAKIQNEGTSYVNRIVRECEDAGAHMVAYAQTTRLRYSPASPASDLADMLESFTRVATDYCIYYTIAFFERPEMDIIRSIIGRHTSDADEQERLFKLCTTSSKSTDTDCEQVSFLTIAAAGMDTDRRRQAASVHAQEYGWLGVRFFLGAWWTTADVLERLESMTPTQAKTLLEDKQRHADEVRESLARFSSTLSTDEAALVAQVRDIIYLRTQRADFFHHASGIVLPLVVDAAKRLRISYHDLLYLTPEEVVGALRGENNDISETLASRKGDVLVYLQGGYIILSGSVATAYVQERPVFNRMVDASVQVVGVTAYRGAVTGRARVVFTPEDANKLQVGEVLVTTMTTPNLIKAMERATAFVTDEGGILCHAAIVAREMKKPCIIGTKIATKVLKDGMMVEVDANEGMVRILERKIK